MKSSEVRLAPVKPPGPTDAIRPHPAPGHSKPIPPGASRDHRPAARWTSKRALDLAGSGVALVLFSPLLLVLAALLKLEGRGPALIRAERMGRRFRPFLAVRFRAPPAAGGPRPTLSGALRRLRLDGLPQIWNVFRGDMSLVGPRAEPPRYVEAHRKDFEEILEVKPGLVGLATTQDRGEESLLARSEDPEKDYLYVVLPERLRWEKGYRRISSPWIDFLILARGARCWILHRIVGPMAAGAGKVIEQAHPHRRALVVAVQVGLIAVSNLLAFVISFEADLDARRWRMFLGTLPLLGLLRLLGFLPFRLFSGLWRYVSVRDLSGIIASVTLSSFAFALTVLVTPGFPDYPRRVLVLDWLLLIFLLSGIRLVKRVLRGIAGTYAGQVRVVIVGAGDAGEMLLREMEMHPSRLYRPVGLVDDDLLKRGASIRGVPVLGTRKDLGRIIAAQRPDEIVIAAPSAPPEVVEEIVRSCRKFGLPVKALPGLRDILCARGLLELMKDVDPENLLGRPAIALASPELDRFYRGKAILVTGAGGSIGSELVRQLARFEPARLVLYERHEYSLYQLEMELRNAHPELAVVPVIGDILDSERVKQVLADHEPAVLFHAAAYKHVPMMELNPREAVRVNVVGTRRLAQLSARAGVERFVLISSDKAVEPTSVMGRTKRLAELTLKHLVDGEPSGTRFMTVRFGNVLESSGSVVPLFKDQIKRGGPVTVTHPDVTRYFMTTAEAVHLVLHTARMGEGGEIFVLDMGQPVRLLSMTKRLISLYGYEPARDIEIVFTGLRPGEKLHEELFSARERMAATSHPKIHKVVDGDLPRSGGMLDRLTALEEVVSNGVTTEEVKVILAGMIQECDGGAGLELKSRQPAAAASSLKRALDIVLASLGVILSSPVLLPILFLVWLQDRHSPFYVAERVGLRGGRFRLVKVRSMVRGADRSGVDSTAATDTRITPLGRFLRSYKLDELPQLWNVLRGDMSLVGPRPNVRRDVDLYTDLEQRLLSVKPGMTDLASIVFADEGEILRGSADPDLEYNRIIRPWKSRLGLFYIDHRTMGLDAALILLTLVAIVSRPTALRWLQLVLRARGADRTLVAVAGRGEPLVPHPPPGSREVVRSRALAS